MRLTIYVLVVFIALAAMAAPASAQSVGTDGEYLVSSYYGEELAGSPTATGEPFDPYGLTAAHKTLPFGTRLLVCYERCVVVRVNDRGPFVAGRDLDLSLQAARVTGLEAAGVGVVYVLVLG